MRVAEAQTPNPRAFIALLALVVLPVLAFALARNSGMESLVRLAAMGVVAVVAGVAFFVRPRYGIYFLAFYVYAGLNFYTRGTPAALALTALIFAGALVQMSRGQRWRLTDPAFLISAGVFTLMGLHSMLWARDIAPAIDSYSKYLKAMLVVCMVVQTVRTSRHLEWLGRWIFFGAVATVFLGLANHALGIDTEVNLLGGVQAIRFAGAHANPNFAAAAMTTSVPLGVYVARRASGTLYRVLAILGVLIVVGAIFATYSRQALFAIAFVAVAVLFREVRSRKAYVAIFAAIVAAILVTPQYYWVRFWTITEILDGVQQDWSIYQRMMALGRAWEMFKEHPIFGVGLRNFSVRSGDVMYLRIPSHNIYLEIACAVGVFGLIAYLSMFYAGIRQLLAGMKERWQGQDERLKDLSFYFLVSVISALISGMFANIEFRYFTWLPLCAGLVVANLRRDLRATR